MFLKYSCLCARFCRGHIAGYILLFMAVTAFGVCHKSAVMLKYWTQQLMFTSYCTFDVGFLMLPDSARKAGIVTHSESMGHSKGAYFSKSVCIF